MCRFTIEIDTRFDKEGTLSKPPLGAFLSGKSTAILPAAQQAELELEAVVSRMPNNWSLIDLSTPKDASTILSYHDPSEHVTLVFSDEFETDRRSFILETTRAYWEAAKPHYWQTGDLEWYDPSAVTTKNDALKITLTKVDNILLNYNLSYRSASSPLSLPLLPSSASLSAALSLSPAPPRARAASSTSRPATRSRTSRRANTSAPVANAVARRTQRGPRHMSRPWDPRPTVHYDAHTRCVSLVSWVHRLEASTTVVQDVADSAQMWLTIHLSDLSPFLLSPIHSRLDAYCNIYRHWYLMESSYHILGTTED
ncbi:beta-glucan synthesis-associated protein-domain-containing protein [Mycena olivaceomarginata]|nr:beta-glucan synthesis-associated protein-domain-containing protein [Mycena olivaceomarginata]